MYRSVATLDSPEFINITPVNPLISECEIKVLYVGENRNRSFITKEVAAEMANSLPGCPIVGYFKEEKDDFADHGQQVIIDDEGVKFITKTKPYGFVSPDAKVWFKKFEDTDDFGVVTEREYLMTNGFLWTGQYEEAKRIIEKGNNQSMELDENSLDGKWAMNHKSGIEFFIINDAIFSKLAILGEDVEPCFEGATITKKDVSSSFSLMDKEFTHTLFSMMQDLQNALSTNEGGLIMTKEELLSSGKKPSEFTAEENALFTAEELEGMVAAEAEAIAAEEARVAAEFAAEEAARLEAEAAAAREAEEAVAGEITAEKYALLQEELETAKAEIATLTGSVEALTAFKLDVEEKQKDALINSFYMLSDEDKAEIVENKANYSLDEIESKLAVICVRNKVSFEKNDDDPENPGTPAITFSVDNDPEPVPAHVSALRKAKKND